MNITEILHQHFNPVQNITTVQDPITLDHLQKELWNYAEEKLTKAALIELLNKEDIKRETIGDQVYVYLARK